MDVSRAHATLGVGHGASYDEVRRAYRRALRAHHPDTAGGNARGNRQAIGSIQSAYRELLVSAPRTVPGTIVPGTYGYGQAPSRPQLVDLYA
jgi:curved DNA-binding protein CbpA